MGLKGTQTEKNILAAFAGESQANRKYLFFAEKAEEEGHKQIARLFRAAAEAETVHARNHLRLAGRLTNNKIVNFDGPDDLIGRFVQVKINGFSPNSLKGVWIQSGGV